MNSQKSRNNFDYSKMSKHQSIAKLFENRRQSRKSVGINNSNNKSTIVTERASINNELQ